jgi:hypothetical protein
MQQVYAQDYKPTAVEGAHWVIRFDELESGIYILEVELDGNRYSQKFIKK